MREKEREREREREIKLQNPNFSDTTNVSSKYFFLYKGSVFMVSRAHTLMRS